MALQHVVFNELLSMGKILAKRSGMNTKLIREPEERQGLELSGDKGRAQLLAAQSAGALQDEGVRNRRPCCP